MTERLHLHAVFGASVFGLCLPRDDALPAGLIERLEHVAVTALMPVFFALVGLSTSADAFRHDALGAFVLILAVTTTPMLLFFSRHRRLAAGECSRHPDQG